jgi:hypothetical protein
LPITSFDLPHDLLRFLDELVEEGTARNRREIVLRALQTYAKLQVQRWNGPFIIINGIRKGLMSKGSLTELTQEMTDEQLYAAGTRMGKTLRISAKTSNLDITMPANYKHGLQMLEDFGWGQFNIQANRITIREPLLPAPIMRGYLESALEIAIRQQDSVEEIQIFEVTQSGDMEEKPIESATPLRNV